MQDVFECRSSARQRRGRAGRVAPGSLFAAHPLGRCQALVHDFLMA